MEYSVCPYGKAKEDCFARKDEIYCDALTNTNFKKDCPFYKTKEQNEKEQEKIKNQSK